MEFVKDNNYGVNYLNKLLLLEMPHIIVGATNDNKFKNKFIDLMIEKFNISQNEKIILMQGYYTGKILVGKLGKKYITFQNDIILVISKNEVTDDMLKMPDSWYKYYKLL